MSRLMGACLLAAMLTTSLGCRPDRSPGDVWSAQQGVSEDVLAQADLAYYWRSPVGLASGEKITRLWRVDENVYCLTSQNRVIAYDAAIGTRRWAAEVAQADALVFSPYHVQNVSMPPRPGPHLAVNPVAPSEMKNYDVVIFNTVSYAVVLDRVDGRELHRIDFVKAGVTANTGTVADGSLVYVAAINGMYAAIDLITGIRRWNASSGDLVSADPVMHSRQIYLASRNGRIFCIATGYPLRPVWTSEPLPGGLTSNFAVDDRGVFAGCLDYNVYAFDAFTGQRSWSFSCQGPVSHPTQLGKTNVYASAEGDKFYAISIVNGTQKWTLPGHATVVAEIGNDVLAVDNRNMLSVVDGASGQVKAKLPMTGLSLFVPNTQAQAIYAASSDGRLCCLRPRAAGHVTPELLRTTTQPAAQ